MSEDNELTQGDKNRPSILSDENHSKHHRSGSDFAKFVPNGSPTKNHNMLMTGMSAI